MLSRRIAYRSGYKYQLAEGYEGQTSIMPPTVVTTDYITLTTQGRLAIRAGYAWDGPSGPAIDTSTFMRASLEHDALCQLVRLGLLPRVWIPQVHDQLKQTCLADGMMRVRAAWVRWAMRFADPATRPSGERPVRYAP